MTAGVRVLHVTDASSSGVLTAVTTIARQQSEDSRFTRVVFAYVPRPDSPSEGDIQALTGPGVEVEKWSNEVVGPAVGRAGSHALRSAAHRDVRRGSPALVANGCPWPLGGDGDVASRSLDLQSACLRLRVLPLVEAKTVGAVGTRTRRDDRRASPGAELRVRAAGRPASLSLGSDRGPRQRRRCRSAPTDRAPARRTAMVRACGADRSGEGPRRLRRGGQCRGRARARRPRLLAR